MSYHKLTPIITEGATEPRYLEDRFADIINVKDYGAKGDGITDDTVAIQAALDKVAELEGGIVVFPFGEYVVSASRKNAVYNNAENPILASTGCLIVYSNTTMFGINKPTIKCSDPSLTVIFAVGLENTTIDNFKIKNIWNGEIEVGVAGHGIFQLSSAYGQYALKNCSFLNLEIENVASYGIGLQNGCPVNCLIENVKVSRSGADCLDLKARLSDDIPYGNTCKNIYAEQYGDRVTGSSAVDVRGIWNVEDITAVNYGNLSTGFEYVGVRIRTIPDSSSPFPDIYPHAGKKTTVNNVLISPNAAAQDVCDGITIGSKEVSVSNARLYSCRYGVVVVGNANGSPTNCTVFNCYANQCTIGFFVTINSEYNRIIGCRTFNCDIGYTINAANTFLSNSSSYEDGTPISIATAASSTLISRDFTSDIYPNIREYINNENNVTFGVGDCNLRFSLSNDGIIVGGGMLRPAANESLRIGASSFRLSNIFTKAVDCGSGGVRIFDSEDAHAIRITGDFETGEQTAGFNASNKPGTTSTSHPSKWLKVNIDSSTYWIPMFED